MTTPIASTAGSALPPFAMVDLDDPRAADADVAGTKGAGLARLRSAGFAVPDGVVLPVGIAAAWPDGEAPATIAAAVADACSRLDGPLAVRTSTTWEDGTTRAHAGATATVLDVTGTEDTLAAIRHCLDESAQAGREHGAAGEIAVVLQHLVPAEWAGVAFSADPITGARDVVRVAATSGLGEALVQGEVIGADLTVRGTRVDVAGGTARTGQAQALPTEIALRVADAARAVEASFGRPHDIEWAMADDTLWLVQARPITTLPIQPALPEGNNWQKDTAHYPEPMTPFGWSLLWACDEDVRAVFDEVGMLIRGLEQVFVGGEIYGRVMPAFGDADGAGKPPPAFVLGIASRLVPELRRRTAIARRLIADNQVQRWVDEWHDHDRAHMAGRAADLAAIDPDTLDDAALAAHMRAAVTLVKDGQRIHFRLVMPWAQRLHALNTLVAEELGWDDAAIATMLGGHSAATRAADDALDDIRTRIRRTDGALAALEARPGEPVDALASVHADLATQVDDWVAEHGWASVNYDAGMPVLAERPRMVTQLLLAEPEAVDHAAAIDAAERARAAFSPARRDEFDRVLAAARAVYPLRDDNTIIVGDRPLAVLRLAMLESGRRLAGCGTISTPADAAYLTVDELCDALTAPAASPDPADLAALVVQRRGEEAWVRANPGPATIGAQGEPPDTSRLPRALRQVNEPVLWVVAHEYPVVGPPPADDDVILAGVAASAGVAEGTVRVIRSHADMHRLVDGDVLVCQVTSPSWAPLFPLARAIVADGGGVLSHAAIAAREHGIPAVLGTGTATSTLRDGQRVRIDGTRGLVLAE
ncbi:MAG: PEP/pyruvate-binding domain-containing protein [Acidimicrobiales bacterium]